jgi:hypothetical protein
VSDCRLDDRGLIPGRGRGFSSSLCVQTSSEVHPASCPMGAWGKGQPEHDTVHLPHLLPRSRISRSYTSLCLRACIVVVGQPFTFTDDILNTSLHGKWSCLKTWYWTSQKNPAFKECEVHYHIHKSLLLDCMLSQLNPVHIFAFSFFKIQFNIIHPFMSMSPKQCLTLGFFDQSLVCIFHFLYICYMPKPFCHPWFYYSTNWTRLKLTNILTV